MPFIRIAIVIGAFLLLPAVSASADGIEFVRDGIRFIGLPHDPNKSYDTSVLPTETGVRRIVAAFDLLIARSPYSAGKIAELRGDAEVVLVYLPGDPPQSEATGENIAVFMPNFRPRSQDGGRRYPVIVGRHGVKWPKKELAAVLAHELVGHGMQLKRNRIKKLRGLDLECEAYLYEERAYQDLGVDKRSRDMVRFRQALETHWCSDFKIFMRQHYNREMRLWERLNPDVPKLLELFEMYVRNR